MRAPPPPQHPSLREGSTPIIADDRGHLLPAVPRSQVSQVRGGRGGRSHSSAGAGAPWGCKALARPRSPSSSQASPWGSFVGTWEMPPRIPPARLDLTSRSAAAAARLIDWIHRPTALTRACNGLRTEITGKVGAPLRRSRDGTPAHEKISGSILYHPRPGEGRRGQKAAKEPHGDSSCCSLCRFPLSRGMFQTHSSHGPSSHLLVDPTGCTWPSSTQCLGHHLPPALGMGLPRLCPKSGLISPLLAGAWAAAATAVPAGGAHKLLLSSRRKASEKRGCPDAERFPELPAPLLRSLLLPGDRCSGASSPGGAAPASGAAVSPARSPALRQVPLRQRGLAQTPLPQHFCPAPSPPAAPVFAP